LIDFLENFNVRTVLTHPTQFYPGSVRIINDLTEAIRENNLLNIKELLAQENAFIKTKT
jgi:phosphoenolpyruvate carboxylase